MHLAILIALSALTAFGCVDTVDRTTEPAPIPTVQAVSELPPTPSTQAASLPSSPPVETNSTTTELALIKGPVSEDGLQAIFATPDLGPGRHRIAFALTSKTGLVDAPLATVQSFYDPQDGQLDDPVETALAVFRPFPLVERGLYATNLTFDRSGPWAIQAGVLGDDGVTRRVQLFFDVPDHTRAPAVGAPAILSVSKTIEDVEELSHLTTGSLQDPDLYQITIADAVDSELPVVIVMASPAFCTNAVCGPQVEVLQELKDEYKDQAHFIHVDLYDNPHEIQGDLDRAVISPIVTEWGLPSAEWSFVIDREGIVAGRFEGFTTLEELRQILDQALDS